MSKQRLFYNKECLRCNNFYLWHVCKCTNMDEPGDSSQSKSFDKVMVVVAILALIGFLLGLYKIMS